MPKKKILTVVGARPQFIKCAALSKQLRVYFHEIIVHTGQHYDHNLSDNFFQELNIPTPDYNLNALGGMAIPQIADIMIKFQDIVQKENPDAIIVFGDTNSTAAASIVAAKNNIRLVHIEAGMREFDKSIPEETNKLITDILADYYFCPTPTAVKWLAEMGITSNVFHSGDIMIDLIETYRGAIEQNTAILGKFNVTQKNYVFATCHRAANTDNAENLKAILSALGQIDVKVIFPIHPRTQSAIKEFGYEELLKAPNIIVSAPIGYVDTQSLIKFAKIVITDSGGITKECFYHATPGILTDKQTEWIETVEQGWNIQAGPYSYKILEAYKNFKLPLKHQNVLGQGNAALIIAEQLNNLLN